MKHPRIGRNVVEDKIEISICGQGPEGGEESLRSGPVMGEAGAGNPEDPSGTRASIIEKRKGKNPWRSSANKLREGESKVKRSFREKLKGRLVAEGRNVGRQYCAISAEKHGGEKGSRRIRKDKGASHGFWTVRYHVARAQVTIIRGNLQRRKERIRKQELPGLRKGLEYMASRNYRLGTRDGTVYIHRKRKRGGKKTPSGIQH